MKKALMVFILIVAAIAAFVIARSVATKQSPSEAKSEIALLPLVARNDGSLEKALPAPEPAPIQIRFEAPAPPQLGKPVPVTLLVESSPKGRPAAAGEGSRLELLLRLPVGVKLSSGGGWSAAALPPEEKEDASGPWSVYEKKIPLQITAGVPPEVLAKETVELTVAEEGVNWIISARARLTQDSQSWQAFGVLFATLQGGTAEFHTIPKGPSDTQSAKTS